MTEEKQDHTELVRQVRKIMSNPHLAIEVTETKPLRPKKRKIDIESHLSLFAPPHSHTSECSRFFLTPHTLSPKTNKKITEKNGIQHSRIIPQDTDLETRISGRLGHDPVGVLLGHGANRSSCEHESITHEDRSAVFGLLLSDLLRLSLLVIFFQRNNLFRLLPHRIDHKGLLKISVIIL